ncbi:MAG TPA: BatD family protein [Puia sp.]
MQRRKKKIKSTVIGPLIPFKSFIFCWLFLVLNPAMSQVHFTAQASTKDMGKADYVEIQFVIENAKEIGDLQPPDFTDFTIVQGPSQSTGMSVVNGVTSQYRGISYVLQPKKTGLLTIKPASATIDGQKLHTNPIQISVHTQTGQGNTKTPGFSPLPDPSWPTAQPPVDMDELVRPGENVDDKIRKNFFIKVDVSKKDCYLGEPIVATYKLYARLRSDSRVTRHPSLNGFSVYDMIDPTDDRVSVEKINGKNYSVHIIRKSQLIPLQAGDVTLDPVELDNNIYFVRADPGGSKSSGQGLGGLLDRLFEPEVSGTPFTQHIVLESKPVVVHVKPLPDEGKPADFNGAVGKYSITASLNTKEVDTGDAAVLSVLISGNGNLPVINAPVVDWPANMESYEVSNKENIDKAVAPLGGTKTYSYSFICSKPGKYILPPVKMSYFDPAAKVYKSIESDPLKLNVKASIKKKPAKPRETPVQTNQTEWTKYALWGSAFLLLALATFFIIRESKKDALLKTEKAKQLAELEKAKNIPEEVDPLDESRQLMQAGDFSKFYASVNRAIWRSVSDNLKLPASELNKLNIASGLRSGGWSDEEIIQLKNVLNECEMKLYTPEYNTSDMQRVLSAAEKIILGLKPKI